MNGLKKKSLRSVEFPNAGLPSLWRHKSNSLAGTWRRDCELPIQATIAMGKLLHIPCGNGSFISTPDNLQSGDRKCKVQASVYPHGQQRYAQFYLHWGRGSKLPVYSKLLRIVFSQTRNQWCRLISTCPVSSLVYSLRWDWSPFMVILWWWHSQLPVLWWSLLCSIIVGKFSLGGLVKCCFTDRLELFLTPTVPNDYAVYKCFTQLFQLNRDIYPHLVICVCVFFKFYPYSLKIVQKSQQKYTYYFHLCWTTKPGCNSRHSTVRFNRLYSTRWRIQIQDLFRFFNNDSYASVSPS